MAASDGNEGESSFDGTVVWDEGDDRHVPRPPASDRLHEWDRTLLLRDSLANEVDRVLDREGPTPAQDVNARDEVPCSTWFCPRNHLTPLSPAAVAAGPPGPTPRLPFRIVKGKRQGATPGFEAVDANGQKFLLKLDPAGRLGLASAAEMVGQRIFHAAGYNVPGASIVDLWPDRDLTLDPAATFRLYGVQKRPLDWAKVRSLLSGAARAPDGRLRVAAVPWLPGEVIGGFDMIGRRPDDPNDRIPHQHRRSLRASWLLFAWIFCLDPSAINTVDSYVEQQGRRFVRHYFIDFGASLGGSTLSSKAPHQGAERIVEVGRTLAAFGSLGLYRRPYQDDRSEWRRLTASYPSLGWFPAESFNPDEYRSHRKIPAHVRRTDRDSYWGAKLVTSFSDAQIDALVATALLDDRQARYLAHALKVRRDIIGRRYLRPVTAVEQPRVTADGHQICFRDLAIERGLATLQEVSYAVEVVDAGGRRLHSADVRPSDSHTCVPAGAITGGGDEHIVQVTTRLAGSAAGPPQDRTLPARIHLRRLPGEPRSTVVGLERDETRDGRAEDGTGRQLSRALLLGPRLVSKAVFWPVLKTSDTLEYHHVPNWVQALLTSDDGQVGVRPELQYSTGFVSTVGGRFFYRRLPGVGSELGARLRAGLSGALLAEVGAQGPRELGLHLRGQWERRRDRLFSGIGPASDAELEAAGRGEARYGAESWLAELGWSAPLAGRWSLGLTGQADRRQYRADRVSGGPSVAELYGLPPQACLALGLPAACTDPALVPGFHRGLRLLEVGGQVGLALGERARHGTGVRLSTGASYAHGIAGDPSRHLRLEGQTVLSLAGLDRVLMLRLQGATVEAVGSTPVPFEELVVASGQTGMRAYADGRFRGPSGVVASAEYRWLISFRLDASLFADVGTVAGPRFAGLLDTPQLFPSFGVGVRWHESTSPHWTAVPASGFQVAYGPGSGVRLLLSLAAF